MEGQKKMKAFLEYYQRQSKSSKRQFLIVLSLIIAALAASMVMRFHEQEVTIVGEDAVGIEVEVAQLTSEKLQASFHTSGVVEVQAPVELIPEVSGRVTFVSEACREGGSFAKNTVLFAIDTRDYEAAHGEALSRLQTAETELKLAKAQSDAAISDWKRMHKKKKIPDLVARLPQVRQAQAAYDAATRGLERSALDLERTEFRLPFDGKIVSATVGVGQYVRAGTAYGSAYSAEKIEVRLPMEKDLLQFYPAENRSAIIAKGSKSFSSRAIRTGATLDTSTRFIDIFIAMDQKQFQRLSLLPGSFVDATLKGVFLPNAFIIPQKYFFDGRSLWTVENERFKRLTPEIVSKTEDSFIVVTDAKSLSVVTTKPFGVEEGMRANARLKEAQEEER